MKGIRSKIDNFFKENQMYYGDLDIDKNCQVFIDDMESGLLPDSESTLKMLCTYISPEGEVPTQEPVIVIDAGGTNFRVALVTFDQERNAIIEDFAMYAMPGTNGEISKEEFFDTITEYLKPVIHKSNKIGFCFSYPTEIQPNKDGRLIEFSKEVRVRDMLGVLVGEELLKTLKEKGIKDDKKLVMLNDTVATALGGKAAYPNRKFDSYIGFILGTGTNTCYIEENDKIKKAATLKGLEGGTIINVESGGYGLAPRGLIDETFDSTTFDPNSQKFEKMISGAYQGGLILEVIKKAARERLFSTETANAILDIEELMAKEIDEFCLYPYSNKNILGRISKTEDDKMGIYYLIDGIIERAARLVVINLASIILKTEKGKNPCLPVCIVAEGTTFYKSVLFRDKMNHYVKTYMNDEKGIYCDFIKAENTTLVGTALAGLLN